VISTEPAVLVLEDGKRYAGRAYGARGRTLGEAVFATGMTGYQETLSDPSYAGQIVLQTAPHIGNTGTNDDDLESAKIWVAGYVVRDPSRVVSNHRATRSLETTSSRAASSASPASTHGPSRGTSARSAPCAPASSPATTST
jgi:carbamoyl-phosphate synthase small subunit